MGARFELIGGHLALDFVNTVDWRDDPDRRKELLADFDDLLDWAKAAKLVGPTEVRTMAAEAERGPGRAMRGLRRARRLREVLARLLTAAAGGSRPAARDLRLLNAFLAAAMRLRRLDARGTAYAWSWGAEKEADLDSLLWPIVLAAADLLASDHRAELRSCGGEGCGWLFLDTSRSRRRRWCTMRGCGNRAKARRFYQRTRGNNANP
jgi:predicted RNA-binding Zn ribbon-like protein